MRLEKNFSEDLNAFVTDCQRVLQEKGKSVAWYRMYEDQKVRIVEGMNSLDGFRIEILPPGHPKNLHNPVFCADGSGKIIRTHGEWTFLKDHITGLLNG